MNQRFGKTLEIRRHVEKALANGRRVFVADHNKDGQPRLTEIRNPNEVGGPEIETEYWRTDYGEASVYKNAHVSERTLRAPGIDTATGDDG